MVGVIRDVGLRSERGPVLLGIMIATFLIAIESTILSTSIPTIVDELGGFDLFPWLFSVYLLAQAVATPICGKLADTFGRKPIIIVGIIGFILTSVLCACAWDMSSLIAGRALQGIAAGAIMPTTLTVIGDIYTVRERGRVQGYTASVWAISAVMAPTLGGLFVQYASWRWIFWVNIPVGLIALWLLWSRYHEKYEYHPRRPDVLGAVLLSGGLVLTVLAVLEGGRTWQWNSWELPMILIAAAVLFIALGFVEFRATDPIIAPWVLRDPIIMTTSIASLLVGIVLIGLVTYVPVFLEVAAGTTPLIAGLSMAAINIGWATTSTTSARFYLRFGFRATAALGGALTVIFSGLGVIFALSPAAPLTALACLGTGLGLGLVATPTLIFAQSSVDLRRRGVVSGFNQLSRAIGSSLGVAALGAVANGVIGGRDDDDAAVMHEAGLAVFVGIAVAAALLFVAGLLIPRTELDPDKV